MLKTVIQKNSKQNTTAFFIIVLMTKIFPNFPKEGTLETGSAVA